MFDRVCKVCISVFILVTVICSYLLDTGLSLYQSRQDFFIAELVNSQASAIERRLSRSLSSTRILAQEIQQNGGLFDGFEEYADEVINSIGGISNLQLAPDGVIQFIHPLAGNEKAIGHNILKDDRRKKEALMALQEQYMTLAGPFELIQGGVAVIGRNPVFLENPSTKQKYFWGFASALIFLEDLLSVTDLQDLALKGYSYELSRIHPDSGTTEVFASSDKPVQKNSIIVSIVVPNGEWMLRMSAPAPVSPYWYYAGYLISALIAAFIVSMLRKILIQPQVLQKVVDQQTKELKQLAHHDHLTGLPNRIQLKDSVDRVFLEYSRYKFSAALLIIDLDDFKPINDLCGHDIGDAVLKIVADRLKVAIRDSDVVARMGGDEFGILLQHADSIDDVNRSIQHIIGTIKEPILVEGQTFNVSVSIGIAYVPQDGEDYLSIYKHADMAMYEAKDTGKDRFYFYDHDLHVRAIERIQTEQSLSSALKHKEFELYLQPIISLSKQELSGYEALIRWNHPVKGLLTPNHFIEVAESSEVIFGLGYWVFSEACKIIRENDLSVKVSVNLSPRQFRDKSLINKLGKIIHDSQVDPTLIELELTESCFIDDIDGAIDTMRDLIQLGLSLSLDDFGTGYSSLTLLQRLPVHKLKIDRSFISDILVDARDRSIVKGLIVMAHELGLAVVAEGIETREQLQLLEEMGCGLGQGYLYSKPKPLSELVLNI
ncbi:EAL domain-containing protein [Neptuniibacter sp. QD29_5]|uniref:bifunctional diguanylate cyclase/phosphodiesterase n=1 Tax=Neptuniibacter sp. QD29_5 TaxID=3398207 RepID=UPI0039F4AB93